MRFITPVIPLAVLCLCAAARMAAQEIICSARDREVFDARILEVRDIHRANFGDTLVAVGKTFAGTPYVAKTLELGKKESLVVNLLGLDCTTFVENALAFSIMLQKDSRSFSDFTETLEFIRYRQGQLDGYPSRLHYFTEWIRDNEDKGLLKDITAELGGEEIQKEINFMSAHRDLYPFLSNEVNFQKIRETETLLNKSAFCVLPAERIGQVEDRLRSGDIIALATSISGLDVTHTGILTRESNGRIHLLHASTGSGEVEVSALPLTEYLKGISRNTGILVARPL